MRAAAKASSEVVDRPVMEHDPLPPVAFLEDSPATEPPAPSAVLDHQPQVHYAEANPAEQAVMPPIVFPEPPRAADPMPYLAQLTPFSGRTNRTETGAEERQQNAAPAVSA